MSFFERYFAALDGPQPHSALDLVSDDVEFVIEWASGSDRKATQLRGGKDELRASIDAGGNFEFGQAGSIEASMITISGKVL